MNAPHGIRPIKAHNSWLVRPVVNRVKDLKGAMIHATRSGKSDGDDGPRTEGWWSNPSNYVPSYNGGSYGDYLIYEDGLIVVCTDLNSEIAWVTAGYGDAGTWFAGYYYIQIEMAQGNINDPYTDAQIESLAWLYADWMDSLGFPLHRIPFLFQTENPPPGGLTTHDTCANGKKLGKSDPGPKFPWEKLFIKVEKYQKEDDMPLNDQDLAKIRQIAREESERAFDKGAIRQLAAEAVDIFMRGQLTDEDAQRIAKESTLRDVQTSIDNLQLKNGG